jgi:hypothetical protein
MEFCEFEGRLVVVSKMMANDLQPSIQVYVSG